MVYDMIICKRDFLKLTHGYVLDASEIYTYVKNKRVLNDVYYSVLYTDEAVKMPDRGSDGWAWLNVSSINEVADYCITMSRTNKKRGVAFNQLQDGTYLVAVRNTMYRSMQELYYEFYNSLNSCNGLQVELDKRWQEKYNNLKQSRDYYVNRCNDLEQQTGFTELANKNQELQTLVSQLKDKIKYGKKR